MTKVRTSARRNPQRHHARPSVVDQVIRAVDAFRRGEPVLIRERGKLWRAYAAETISDTALKASLRIGSGFLVLTHARARTLKIRLYTPEVVALALDKDSTKTGVRAIADPTEDLAFPMKGPFPAERHKLPGSYAAAVKLAKLAGLLPAAVVSRRMKVARGQVVIGTADIMQYDDEIVQTLTLVTRARVPLEGAEQTELIAFRPADGGPEHYAVVIGKPETHKPVLTRLHSECFTGDLLASLKCDCGNQLRGAITAIAANEGGGILLYLAQEGRGIGLINKLRAYRLQDQGFDTLVANERLGFEAEERVYGIAAKMLRTLGFDSVRLLTNNPDKMRALHAAGIEVVERVPHAFPGGEHSEAYLRTKAERAGHLL